MVDFIKAIADIDADVTENPKLWSRNSNNVAKIAQFLGGTTFGTAKSLRLYSRPSIKKKQATRAWLSGGRNANAVLALENTAKFLKKFAILKKVLSEYATGVTDRWIKDAIAESP
jgi:taurine transport system substrate-binding protein